MEIEKDVIEIIKEQLLLSVVKVDDKIIEDLGADSLDAVELVIAIEEKFDIEIMDEEAEKISTVQDAIDFVKKKSRQMNEIEELKITKHLDGKLKGFYTVYFAGTKEPMMKSKTKSKLLKSLFKHYAGQGE